MRKLLFTLGLFGFVTWTIIYSCNEPPKVHKTVFVPEDTTLHLTTLKNYIIKIGIKSPEVVFRQACLETGFLTSYQCRKNNNLFGFMIKYKYKEFSSWKQCCDYYKSWQDKYYKEDEYYYRFLDNTGFAADSAYIWKLKRITLPNEL